MTPKEIANQNLANTIIKNMAKKNLEGYYCATSAEEVEKALSLMPEGSSVTWGGSMTLTECGLMDALPGKGYELGPHTTCLPLLFPAPACSPPVGQL